jgi:hypothetical protein
MLLEDGGSEPWRPEDPELRKLAALRFFAV